MRFYGVKQKNYSGKYNYCVPRLMQEYLPDTDAP